MGLVILVFGLAVLLAPHTLTAFRAARQGMVDRLGLGPYKAIYSLVSLAGILLIAFGYGLDRSGGRIELWHPPIGLRHFGAFLVWPAVIMIMAAYVPGRIKVALKHPFLAGIKLWAAAHLIANGDLASIVLFGTILGWAVFDRISLRHRTDAGGPQIPIGGLRKDAIAVAAGTVLYILLVRYFHPYVIGVAVFGR